MAGSDANKGVVQAFREPVSGVTTKIVTAALASAKTPTPLKGGWYQVYVPLGAGILRFAAGAHATTTATSNDRPRIDGVIDYTFIEAGGTLAVFDAGAGGAIVELTEMPL